MQQHKARGSALLSALFIMSLITIVATSMLWSLQNSIYRTQLIVSAQRKHYALQLASFWAISELGNPHKQFSKVDEKQRIAVLPPVLQVLYPGYHLQANLYDLQAKFNINNLNDMQYFPIIERLFKRIPIKLSSYETKQLFLLINQWIKNYDPKYEPVPLLEYYLSQTPPYLQAHQLAQSVSELRLIKGVSPNVYRQLEPYLTALPIITPLNINTASPWLLHILGNGLKDKDIDQILEARGEHGITDENKFALLIKRLNIPASQVSLRSKYFLAIATVSDATSSTTQYTILERSWDKQGKIHLSILNNTLNTL